MPPAKVVADACGRAVRRSLPGLAAIAAIALVSGALWLGYRFVTTSPRFAITDIQIAGNARLTADEVRAAMPVAIGDNVFTADLVAIGDSLRTHPWIASAEVRRILPHTLVVEIHEHEPAGIVALDALYLVDAGGHPFKRVQLAAEDGEGLPIVTGLTREAYRADPIGCAEAVSRAVAVTTAWESEAGRPLIGEVNLDAHRAITLRTYDRAIAIQLGQISGAGPELAQRMHTFDAAWAELDESERQRARSIYLDAHADARPHVTIAFAKD